MTGGNVVPRMQPLTEEQFRTKWLRALSRLCDEHGDSQVALWLGVGDRHLRNIKAGSSIPTADKIWNLLFYDASAHDELDKAYGAKNVPAESVCTTDPLTLAMVTLARDVAEAEAPDSHGGHVVTDHELLAMDEALLRKVHRTVGGWMDRLERIRS